MSNSPTSNVINKNVLEESCTKTPKLLNIPNSKKINETFDTATISYNSLIFWDKIVALCFNVFSYIQQTLYQVHMFHDSITIFVIIWLPNNIMRHFCTFFISFKIWWNRVVHQYQYYTHVELFMKLVMMW